MTQHRKTIPLRLAPVVCIWVLAFAAVSLATASGGVESGKTCVPQLAALANLPLYFEANQSSAPAGTTYVARGRDCSFFVTPTEASLTLAKCVRPAEGPHVEQGRAALGAITETRTLQFEFLDTDSRAKIAGVGELPGKVNYLLGSDPARWRTGMSLFQQVRVNRIYPGVDLVYYGNQRRLEFDFVVAPKADPRAISLRVTGADETRVDARGDLVFTLGRDEIRQPKPLIYQTVGGMRKEIAGGFQLTGKQTVTFQIGEYDHNLPLVIDPVLSYATFFGGTGSDMGRDIAVDSNGFVYVAGVTTSPGLATPGAFQTNYISGGQYDGDVFVAKFDNLGTTLSYLTYLGGNSYDAALGLALDGAGNAYITGFTSSTNFPSANALQPLLNGTIITNYGVNFGIYPLDAFVAELNTNGSALVFSTYLGGNDNDEGIGIAVDPNRFVYVTGFTYSTNFPTTNAAQQFLNNPASGATNAIVGGSDAFVPSDAFVTKLTPDGSNFVYSTYLGGTNNENGDGIVADADGCAYVTGFTYSTNFPTTTNAVQKFLNNPTNNATAPLLGPSDAFISKFRPDGGLDWSTFLGGWLNDVGFRIALDAETNVFVTGSTVSTNFPAYPLSNTNLIHGLTNNVINTNLYADVFVAKMNSAGTGLVYSVKFGGSAMDEGWDLAVDSGDNAHIVGRTRSTNFPTSNTSGFLRATNSGGFDAFVTVLNSNGTAILRSAYLGGSTNDFGYAIKVDAAGNDYIVGETSSTNFPTYHASQSILHGTNDTFIAKILGDAQPSLQVVPSGPNVSLLWPAYWPEFNLQASTNVALINGWVDITNNQPVLSDGWLTVTLGATNDASFFRLHGP
jgi:Beta-propeller repeat